MTVKRAIIHADGAAQSNPGMAAIGATIKDEQGNLITPLYKPVGRMTNNQAEYRAVICAVEEALRLGIKEADIYMDSELVVNQVSGKYRVKSPKLVALHEYLNYLLTFMESHTITHIPREENTEADRLANLVLRPLS